MKNDFRARNHPAYWAFIVHRVSGLLLAVFLPFHFWVLGQALRNTEALEVSCAGASSRWSSLPRPVSYCCSPRIWRAACGS